MGTPLGVLKGDFNQKTDWKEWSQEMQDYCVQDVKVTHKLWKHLAPEKWSQRSIRFEHRLAELCHRIGTLGGHSTQQSLVNSMHNWHWKSIH